MDEMSIPDILSLINSEDAKVAESVRLEIPHIATVVEEIVERFKLGGRLFYVGAGTSGRMGKFMPPNARRHSVHRQSSSKPLLPAETRPFFKHKRARKTKRKRREGN